MMVVIGNIVGIIGDILLVLAYFLLQSGRLSAKNLSFSMMNFWGAMGILFSLIFSWNLPAAVIEIVWGAISLFGMWRLWQERRKTSRPAVK